VITPAEFKKNYYPVMQKDLVTTGGIYGLPLGADTLALFVNTELLKAQGLPVPKNWDDFLKASKELTVRDPASGKIKTAGAALGTYGNITHASDIMALLFAQQGVGEPGATTRNQMDALTFYTSFAAGDKGVWDSTLDESVLAFSRGNLGMYFGYSWDVFTINKLNEKLAFTVNPVPGLPGKNKTIASYWVEGISANSTHKKEAFLFMNYLAKKETQQKLFADQSKVRAFGEPYARVDLAESLKDNALVYPFVSQLPIASSTYFASSTFDGDAGLNALLNSYLENAINGMLNNNISAKSTVETLNEGIAKSLKQYGILAAPIKSE
jgi:multiple sugar transport system substrate-binding protein